MGSELDATPLRVGNSSVLSQRLAGFFYLNTFIIANSDIGWRPVWSKVDDPIAPSCNPDTRSRRPTVWFRTRDSRVTGPLDGVRA
jgi:hypothetical protein